MKTRLASALLLLLPLAPCAAQDYKAPVAKLDLQNGDTLVFLGDSITHQCLYTQYVEDYYYTRYPERRIRFHNSGVGGDRNNDALIRFEQDVARYKPKYVTVLLGMNDGRYQAFDKATFDTYEADMKKVVEEIKKTGATAILMTPTMYDARAARIRGRGEESKNRYYNSTLAYYGSLLREMAFKQGLGFVDMFGPLNQITLQQRKKDPNFTAIADAVHPDPAGQVIMAAAILNDMQADRLVSSVHVVVGKGSEPKLHAKNATATNGETDGTNVAFTLKAKSLPWVLPEEARSGYALARCGHRLSREALRVSGLKPGKYDLRIDGATVGTYAARALERGIELQGNAKTPQYQQALEVAMLNKARNDGAYKQIRNLWRAKKSERFAAAKAKANPDSEDLAKQLVKEIEKTKNFEPRLKELEAKAKTFEDNVYKTNQPKEHRYQLSPAK